MQAKTTDGYDLVKGSYYYTENGQEVMLEEAAINLDGDVVFKVTPHYEGEAMSASGDGGYHHEITCPYIHEGEPILVNSIFKKEPVEKIGPEFKAVMDNVLDLAASIGGLERSLKELKITERALNASIKDLESEETALSERYSKSVAKYDELADKTLSATQNLSELEDSIGDGIHSDAQASVDKKELIELRKKSYKMDCLMSGGVDNWEWYDESLKAFSERYPEG